MDNLVSLLKAVGPGAVNAEVRNKILELIQSWATATEGRYELNYIGEVYKTLQRERFVFPPRVSVSSSMIDSSAVGFTCYVLRMMLTIASLPNGLIPTFACDAEPHLHSRTESIIAATAEVASINSARPNHFRCHTSVSFNPYGSTTAAMRSSQTSHCGALEAVVQDRRGFRPLHIPISRAVHQPCSLAILAWTTASTRT